jgi:MATE family multidrug resistance protein
MLQKYYPHYRSLLKLAIPLVLTQAGQMTVLLVDTAMVGHVGTTALAAAAFANNIYIVIMLFGLGIFLGITPLISRACGAGDEPQIAVIMKNGFSLSLLLLGVITIGGLAVTWLMPFMGQNHEVVSLSIPFYRLLVISTIPFLFFVLLKQIGEGLSNTVIAMAATITANLINLALNYVLIFGKLGFPKLGLMGSGYATLIARIAMPLLLYAGFMTIKPIRRHFSMVRKVKTTIRGIKEIFGVGVPIATQLILEVMAFSFSAVMMGWLGNIPLASHQVALNLATFTFMIANGVAMAATIRVSYQLGTRDFESMERLCLSATHLVLGYMGLCGLGFFLFRHQLPYVFTTDRSVIEQTARLLMIAAVFQIFDGLQIVCIGILRGLADVKAPMFFSAFSYVVVGLPVSYLCAFTLRLGPEGIWYGFVAGLISAGILLSLRIRRKISELERQV